MLAFPVLPVRQTSFLGCTCIHRRLYVSNFEVFGHKYRPNLQAKVQLSTKLIRQPKSEVIFLPWTCLLIGYHGEAAHMLFYATLEVTFILHHGDMWYIILYDTMVFVWSLCNASLSFVFLIVHNSQWPRAVASRQCWQAIR